MILLLILHLLIRPAYADDATVSASLSPTPVIRISPSDTPLVTDTPLPTEAITPLPTVTPTLVITPTDAPLRGVATPVRTTPSPSITPTPAQQPLAARFVTPPPKPLAKQIRDFFAPITFPEDFFLHSTQMNYYPSTKLSDTETTDLLFVAGIAGVLGVLLMNWERLMALAAKWKPRKIWTDDINYVINEV